MSRGRVHSAWVRKLSSFWRSIGGSKLKRGGGILRQNPIVISRAVLLLLLKWGFREGVGVWTRHAGQRCATYNCRLLYPGLSRFTCTLVFLLSSERNLCAFSTDTLHKFKQAGVAASRERQLGERSASKSSRTDSGLHDDIWFPHGIYRFHTLAHIYIHTYTHIKSVSLHGLLLALETSRQLTTP